MKFYIIKPKSQQISPPLVVGILSVYPDAESATSIDEADTVILQGNWTLSKYCMEEYKYAKSRNKKILEDHGFLWKYRVHLN